MPETATTKRPKRVETPIGGRTPPAPLTRFFGTMMTRRTAAISALFLLIVALAGVFAPIVAPHDPTAADLLMKLKPPSLAFPMGTDHLGRCILSRCIWGVRTSLGVSVLMGMASVLIGMLIGITSGYIGGRVDSVIMRFCDALLAYPSLILVLIVIAVLGIGLKNIFIAMLLVHWVWYARLTRGMTLSLKTHAFVTAARISGSSRWAVISRHMVPNIIPQIVPLFTVDLAGIILQMAGLSFLGIGVQPPTPEWGAMINDGRTAIRQNPMVMAWPSLVIIAVVLAMNIVSEFLRQYLEGEPGE